jgi:hypothetical protein
MKCDCGGNWKHYATVDKNDQWWIFWQCDTCNKPTHTIEYKYDPSQCPGHKTEYIGCEFVDDPHYHHINHVRRCFVCGLEIRIPMDTRSIGIAKRIDIDDPHFKKQLLWNQSAFERTMPKELQEMSAGILPKQAILPAEQDT